MNREVSEHVEEVVATGTLTCARSCRASFVGYYVLLLVASWMLHEVVDGLGLVVHNVIVEAHVETLKFHSVLLLFLLAGVFDLLLLHGLEVLVPIKVVFLLLGNAGV